MSRPERVLFLSFDVEPDAPPYFNTTRGLEEGLPGLLDLLDELKVKASFFVVARLVEERGRLAREIVDRGHELASHGYSHVRLDRIPPQQALEDVARSLRILRRYYDVISFRAPNLAIPGKLVQSLTALGVKVDSSLAAYKPPFRRSPTCQHGLLRVPTTVTSSVLRMPGVDVVLPRLLRSRYVTLFAHPWEFVSVRHWRPDIWVGTGPGFYLKLKRLLKAFQTRGYEVRPVGHAIKLVKVCGDGQA